VQSVWRLDPTSASPTWRYDVGSNSTDAAAVVSGEPVPRFGSACDAAPSNGAYCFGGYSHLNGSYS
jgi:hypothetical protein